VTATGTSQKNRPNHLCRRLAVIVSDGARWVTVAAAGLPNWTFEWLRSNVYADRERAAAGALPDSEPRRVTAPAATLTRRSEQLGDDNEA